MGKGGRQRDLGGRRRPHRWRRGGDDGALPPGPPPSTPLDPVVRSPSAAAGGRPCHRSVSARTARRICTLALPPLLRAEDPDPGADPPASSAVTPETAAPLDDGASAASAVTRGTSATAATTVPPSSAAGAPPGSSSASASASDRASLPEPRLELASCDPLIAFGRYVAAAASDGRVCLFEVREFEADEDVRPMRAPFGGGDGAEEEDWAAVSAARDRMRAAEDMRSAVPPIATVGPFLVGRAGAAGAAAAKDDAEGFDAREDAAFIVAMCATPVGTSLVQYRYRRSTKGVGSLYPPPPSADLLGHLVVLTSEGEVHVLEVMGMPGRCSRGMAPKVDVIATFSTGECGATCLCLHRVNPEDEDENENGEEDRNANDKSVLLRLCIGHQSGTLVDYELVSMVTQTKVKKSSNSASGDMPEQNQEGINRGAGPIGKPTLSTQKQTSPHTFVSKAGNTIANDAAKLTEEVSNKSPSCYGSSNALDRIAEIAAERLALGRASSKDAEVPDGDTRMAGPASVHKTEKSFKPGEKAPSSLAPPSSPQKATTTDISTAVTPLRGSRGAGTPPSPSPAADGRPPPDAKAAKSYADAVAVAEAVVDGPGAAGPDTPATTPSPPLPPTPTPTLPPPPPDPPLLLRYSKPRPRSAWRGCFDSPVRCVSSLGGCLEGVCADAEPEGGGGGADADPGGSGGGPVIGVPPVVRRRFLAVGLVSRVRGGGGGGGPPSSTMEVVDAASIEREWVVMTRLRTETDQDDDDNEAAEAVPLVEHCIWPGVGMEVRDSWTWSSAGGGPGAADVRGEAPVAIPGVSLTGSMCAFIGRSPAFAASLSDGTVAICHSLEDREGSYDPEARHFLAWGIAHDCNQVILPNACIGLALLDASQVSPNLCNAEKQKFVSCCDRRGTVYFIPVTPPSTQGEGPQRVFMYQLASDLQGHDNDVVHFVQGFTAGYIQVLTWENANAKADNPDSQLQMGASGKSESMPAHPVYLHAWGGGLIDVYKCGLSCSCDGKVICSCAFSTEDDEDIIIGQLVKNGTVQLLVDQLLSMQEQNDLLSDDLWRGAWEECRNCQLPGSIVQAVRSNDGESMHQFRELLMFLTEAQQT